MCVVDWGNLSQNDYKSASMSIFDVGLTVAGIIIALEEMRPKHFHRSNVTLAGYSLGAHAAGYAGAVLDGQVEQIIGLDPAGPLFTLPAAVSPKYRLDQTDAQFVQVLHTSGGTLGTSLKCGHADFYPNGGRAPQRNCLMFMNLRDMQNTSEFQAGSLHVINLSHSPLFAPQIPSPAATRQPPYSSGNPWTRSIPSWAPNAIAIATTRPDVAIVIGVLASASTRRGEAAVASTSTPAPRIPMCSDSVVDALDPTHGWDQPYSFAAGTVSESGIGRRQRSPMMPMMQPTWPAQ